MTPIAKWTSEEDDLLRENYENCTIKELMKLLPHRTKAQIDHRLHNLNIRNKSNPKWAKEEDEILIKYYQDKDEDFFKGLLNRTYKNIRQRANKLGLTRGKSEYWTDDEIQILKDYFTTSNKEKMLQLLPNRGYPSIMGMAHRLGLIRVRGAWNYYVNEDFFNPLTPESAYVLGFIYADGNINKHQRAFEINITDYDLLVDIKNSMESEHPFYIQEREKNKDKNWKNLYCFRVNSAKMTKNLMEFGLVPNKSLVIELPSIDDNLMPHFIRGYFDGDGCVSICSQKGRKHQRLIVYFCSGSIKFLEQLKSYFMRKYDFTDRKITINKNTNVGNLSISPKDYQKFFELIYQDADIYLKRKYDKFLQFGFEDILNSPLSKEGDFLISHTG